MIIKIFDEFYFINIDMIKGQVDIFGTEHKVQKPGSRGSTQWWIDEKGNVRYDPRPTGISKKKMRAAKEQKLWQELGKKRTEKKPEIESEKGKGKSEKGKFVEISELKPGDKVRYIPDDKEFADEIVGTVRETINDNTGVHIFNPIERDPYHVSRVWGRNGKFEIIERYKESEKKIEKPAAKQPPKEFKSIDDLNDWYTKLSKPEQSEQKDFYEKEFDRIVQSETQMLSEAVEKENVSYLKNLGYDEKTIDRMSSKTKNEIVDKHLPAEKVSVLQGGEYKVVSEKSESVGESEKGKGNYWEINPNKKNVPFSKLKIGDKFSGAKSRGIGADRDKVRWMVYEKTGNSSAKVVEVHGYPERHLGTIINYHANEITYRPNDEASEIKSEKREANKKGKNEQKTSNKSKSFHDIWNEATKQVESEYPNPRGGIIGISQYPSWDKKIIRKWELIIKNGVLEKDIAIFQSDFKGETYNSRDIIVPIAKIFGLKTDKIATKKLISQLEDIALKNIRQVKKSITGIVINLSKLREGLRA